jgi:hypothetical protein
LPEQHTAGNPRSAVTGGIGAIVIGSGMDNQSGAIGVE